MVCECIKSGRGAKHDGGKRRWTLLPLEALEVVVDVLEFGAKKYAPGNWRRMENWRERYSDALWRHFIAYQQGEYLDPETKLPHLAQLACNSLFLLALEIAERAGKSSE